MKLFDDDFGEDNSPIEDVDVTQVIFYFDVKEVGLFKKLCKEALKIEFPTTYQDSNITDLFFKILKERYGNALSKKGTDTQPVGSAEGDIFERDTLRPPDRSE